MGDLKDFAAFAAKVDNIARDLDGGALRKVTGSVALEAKNDMHDLVAEALGSDRKMSGWGKFSFNARYDLTSDHSADLTPRPLGPWLVLERGRNAKPAGLPKRKPRKVYRTPHGLRTATKGKPWPVGATAGKRTWTKGTAVIARETPGRVNKHIVTTLTRHLGG